MSAEHSERSASVKAALRQSSHRARAPLWLPMTERDRGLFGELHIALMQGWSRAVSYWGRRSSWSGNLCTIAGFLNKSKSIKILLVQKILPCDVWLFFALDFTCTIRLRYCECSLRNMAWWLQVTWRRVKIREEIPHHYQPLTHNN